MAGDDFLFLFIAIIIGMLVYNFLFSRKAIVKRRLRRLNGKKINEFQNGDVAKTVGEVKYVGKTLVAPLSGRKCVYYHIIVEKSSGKSSHTLIEEERAGDVVIKNGNDYALIDTSLVKSHLIADANYSSGLFKDATRKLENYLKMHGHESTNLLGFNHAMQYNEGVLEEGELLVVAGKGEWRTSKEFNLRIPAVRVLVIKPEDEKPVYFTDDPETTRA